MWAPLQMGLGAARAGLSEGLPLIAPGTLQHVEMIPSVNLVWKLDYCSFASWKSSAIKKESLASW